MTTETCKRCGEIFEPGYSVCWRCGTHVDGSPAAPGFVADDLPLDAAVPARKLNCLRCDTAMALVGRRKFHEGTRSWPFLFGQLGELFVHREAFDTYACPGCGKVEFFVAGDPGKAG
jgi:hypothetical protein